MCSASDYEHLGHVHQWGPVERAPMTGNPHRKCTTCPVVTMDLGDDDEDTTCPVCGQDNDPAGGGCSCYGTSDPELDDAHARWIITERSRLLSLSGLPLEADALAFAQSLRFVP